METPVRLGFVILAPKQLAAFMTEKLQSAAGEKALGYRHI